MFERFTDSARRVIVLAQEEARMLSHGYIGTEHLLLGLIHEDEGVAARTLASYVVTREKVIEQIESFIGRGTEAPSGHIPFTPRARKLLEGSIREAMKLLHNYVGTEHILLSLLTEDQALGLIREGVAGIVLDRLKVDLKALRRAIYDELGASYIVVQVEKVHPRPKHQDHGKPHTRLEHEYYRLVIDLLDQQIMRLEKLARNACRSKNPDRRKFGEAAKLSVANLKETRKLAQIGLERVEEQ